MTRAEVKGRSNSRRKEGGEKMRSRDKSEVRRQKEGEWKNKGRREGGM